MRIPVLLLAVASFGCSTQSVSGSSSASSASSASSTIASSGAGGAGAGGAGAGGAGGEGGMGLPPCEVKTAGTSALTGLIERGDAIQGNPGCTKATSPAQRLQVIVLDTSQPCATSSECANGACFFGLCIASGLAAAPKSPDFDVPGTQASYCTANTSFYPQLPPGKYELFAFYDCDGDDNVSAGDLVSADPPSTKVTTTADTVTTAPVLALDRECTGACATAFMP